MRRLVLTLALTIGLSTPAAAAERLTAEGARTALARYLNLADVTLRCPVALSPRKRACVGVLVARITAPDDPATDEYDPASVTLRFSQHFHVRDLGTAEVWELHRWRTKRPRF